MWFSIRTPLSTLNWVSFSFIPSMGFSRLSTEELMLSNCGVGEDFWESLRQQIKPVNPTGNQPWIFIGRTDAESEAPIFWPPDAKNWLIGKDSETGKDWRQKKRATEDEMVGWHHWLNGHELKKILGNGEGQGSLACCCPWGHKELDTTEWLNTTTTQTHWIRKPRLVWQTPGVIQKSLKASASVGHFSVPSRLDSK